MDIFSNTDLTRWVQGKVSFEELLEAYGCTIGQMAETLDVPHPHSIVAYRHAESWWPVEVHKEIMTARRQYDAGMIELATGRTGNHFFLYCFPRKKHTKVRFYFRFDGAGNGQ